MTIVARHVAVAGFLLGIAAWCSCQMLLREAPSQENPPPRIEIGASSLVQDLTNEAPESYGNAPTTSTSAPETEQLLAALEAEPDADAQGEMLEHAAQELPASHIPAMLEALGGVETQTATALFERLLRRWAETAPASAAEWASRLPEGPTANVAVSQVVGAWAVQDLSSAKAWLSVLGETETKRSATTSLAYEAARSNPLVSLELACSLPANPERDALLAHGVSQWAAADPAAAEAWAERATDTGLRQRLLAAIAISSAQNDACAAATIVVQALAPGEEQNRAAVAVVQRWAQSSPNDAADWVFRFPETPTGREAVSALVGIWALQDPNAANNWVDTLPEGSLRQVGLAALANKRRH